MKRVSARTSGTVIAVTGLALAVVHLQSAIRLRVSPRLLVVEAIVPLALALGVAGTGGLLREGRLGPTAFVDRVLGWTVVGTVALVVAVGWLFADAAVRGQPVLGAGRTCSTPPRSAPSSASSSASTTPGDSTSADAPSS